MCLEDRCVSHQYHKNCQFCIYITGGQKIDLRTLVRCTILPELWNIFTGIINVSPVADSGFTLSNAQTFLNGCKLPSISHKDFWATMMYFLKRMNTKFRIRREQKLRELKSKFKS